MKFQNKLIEIMQKRGITAQDISKLSKKKITVTDVRSFQNGTSLPTGYQITFLNHIFGIDFELLAHPSPKYFSQVERGTPVTKFEKVDEIKKPVKTVKPKEVNILKPPDEKHCRWCDTETGTECFRHPEDDTIKYLAGGGVMGGKNPDQFSVWGCFECDQKYSTKPDKENYIRQLEHSLKWAKGIIKTWLM